MVAGPPTPPHPTPLSPPPSPLQGSTLVVGDRPTAQATVSHFEQHRVGVATCRILSELRQPQGGNGAAAGAGPDGLSPLVACLETHPGVPCADALMQNMLRDWWLAPDRQAALAAVQQDRRGGGGRRRRSIVTLQVFQQQAFSWGGGGWRIVWFC